GGVRWWWWVARGGVSAACRGFGAGVGVDAAVAAEAVLNSGRVPVFAEPLREDAGGRPPEAARRYANNDFDRLRRRKLCLHGHGCEIDAEHEQRSAEAASRKVGNPNHAVAPCPGARFGQIFHEGSAQISGQDAPRY